MDEHRSSKRSRECHLGHYGCRPRQVVHPGGHVQVEFVHLSSYRTATVSSGQVEILRDVQSEVRGRDVLLVDDILESGRTVVFAKDLLMARGARLCRAWRIARWRSGSWPPKTLLSN